MIPEIKIYIIPIFEKMAMSWSKNVTLPVNVEKIQSSQKK